MNEQTNTQGSAPLMPPAAPVAHNNKLMGILSYLGILIIIPYFVAKDESFVKFHIKQGLVLVSIEVVLWLLGMVLWNMNLLWPIFAVLRLAIIILAIIGIVNVVGDKEKELPIVGQYAKKFNI